MAKMKALVKKYPEKGIWMEEVTVPEYGNNDLLIKIKITAICGTDLKLATVGNAGCQPPRVIGHEAVVSMARWRSSTGRHRRALPRQTQLRY